MKIDFTIKFAKTSCTTYKIVNGKPNVKTEYIPPYVAHIVDNLLGREEYDVTRNSKSIVDTIFRLITLEENRLNIDQSFYKKYLVGWYSLDENMEEFLIPTKVERIYECMFNHMENHTSNEGILVLYFELI